MPRNLQCRYRLRHPHAAANVEHRLLRLSQHLQSVFDIRIWEVNVIGYHGEMRIEIALSQLDVFGDIDQYRAGAP